jgi:hypothetical protein
MVTRIVLGGGPPSDSTVMTAGGPPAGTPMREYVAWPADDRANVSATPFAGSRTTTGYAQGIVRLRGSGEIADPGRRVGPDHAGVVALAVGGILEERPTFHGLLTGAEMRRPLRAVQDCLSCAFDCLYSSWQ